MHKRGYKPGIKAVLFDLDDTLWAITPVLQRAEIILYEWLQQYAPGVTRTHTIESLRAQRVALSAQDPAYKIDMWRLRHTVLTQALIDSGEDHTLANQAMDIFSDARNAVTPFDDVVPVLNKLKSTLLLGTISNGFADLGQIGLAHHFHTSIAAHQFGAAKPSASIFHAACDALNISPSHAVYVGDDLHLDISGAQQAGLQAIWMNRFRRALPSDVKPDAICTDMFELEAWLCHSQTILQ